jgi:hypothetical protein
MRTGHENHLLAHVHKARSYQVSLRHLSSPEIERSGCSNTFDQESAIDNENFKFASMCCMHCVQILSLVVVYLNSFCIN